MEDSVCPSTLTRTDRGDARRAHLIGALLDEFLEVAIDRVASGTEDPLFEEAEREPALRDIHRVADLVVDHLEEQLTASEEDAVECIESLDRARKEPLLRELVLEEWEKYFRASVSPKKILAQLVERHSSGLESATTESQRQEAFIALAQTAVFLTSVTSQLKTHLEQVFAREPALAWMSRW
jgi:hypothetical protein